MWFIWQKEEVEIPLSLHCLIMCVFVREVAS